MILDDMDEFFEYLVARPGLSIFLMGIYEK